MPHVVLLGDSIFDNAAYVSGGPDVIAQLRAALPADWRATLLAVDGSITVDVRHQVARLPADATHLVLSVGGNDALSHAGILQERASSAAQVLGRLAGMREEFAPRYREALGHVLRPGLPTTVCTIYEGSFPEPEMQRLAATALTVFNDVILRTAFEAGAGVVELRAVCDSPADYANPIEPSVVGGEKIARTLARVVTGQAAGGRHSVVVAG